jgi:FkbM family methyltransferase
MSMERRLRRPFLRHAFMLTLSALIFLGWSGLLEGLVSHRSAEKVLPYPETPVKVVEKVTGELGMVKSTAAPVQAKNQPSHSSSYELQRVGTEYGGWTYDSSPLTSQSIVYSIGLGEDTSWDEGILSRHNLQIWGFDPTPKSLEYVRNRKQLQVENFHLVPEGLATTPGTRIFTKPKDANHVSMRSGNHSDMGETIEISVNSLEQWMTTFHHSHIDILKMDVEGSEYDVLEEWIRTNYFPFDQLLVEWHFRFLPNRTRHDKVIRGLQDRGWIMVHTQNQGQEMTFLRRQKYRSSNA